MTGFNKCRKCGVQIGSCNGVKSESGRRWYCRACRHNYCKNCYLAFHNHPPDFWLGFGYSGVVQL